MRIAALVVLMILMVSPVALAAPPKTGVPAELVRGNTTFATDLYRKISEAVVDVNEEGTEAAAGTAVVMRTTSAPPVKPTPVFRADHPFSYLIRDVRTRTILFFGRVADPN